MTNEERFKKNLEDLLAAKDFSFDEANWDKARDLIDASKEKKRRRVVPFIILGLLLVTGLGTGVYLLSEGSSPSDKTLSETKTNSIPKQESKTSAPEVNLQPELNKKNTSPSLQTPEAEKTPGPTKEPVTPVDIKSVEKIKGSKIKHAEVKASVNAEIKVAEEIPVVLPSSPSPGQTKRKSNKKETTSVENPRLAKPMVVPVEQSAHAASAATEGPHVKENNTDRKVSENSVDKNQETQKPSHEKSDAVVKSSPIPVKDKKEETQEVVPGSEIRSDATPGKKEESSDLAQTLSGIPDSTKTAQRDSILLKPGDNADGELGKTKERVIVFSVEAGANYMLGWKNSPGRDANGFDPVIGINYFNNFKSKMALTVGLQYTSVSKLSYSNYTSKVVRLALGEESQVSVFTPTKLHYLIMPLRFEYSLNPKNAFGMGCNVAYLLNVQSNVETYSEKMGTKYDIHTSKEKGYTKGFKPYDTQVSLFYKRTLHPNFAVNLEFYYGFTDIKDNTFFNANVRERNTGAKLTLVYNFLKK